MSARPRAARCALGLVALWLAACGGGSVTPPAASPPGGADPPPVASPPPAPAVTVSVTQAPADATVDAGASATFSVVATSTGSGPLAYQWRRDGQDIAGATSARYTTPPLNAADNGARFDVRVSDGTVQAVSTAAVLVVRSGGGCAAAQASLAAGPAFNVTTGASGQVLLWSGTPVGAIGKPVAGSAASQLALPACAGTSGIAQAAVVVPDGSVFGWGKNTNGQLGDRASDGSTNDVTVPRRLPALAATRQLAVLDPGGGVEMLFALGADGRVRHLPGDMRQDSSTWRSTPREVQALQDVIWIGAAPGTSGQGMLAVRADGSVWRLSSTFALPNPPAYSHVVTAAPLPGVSGVRSLFCPISHCLALLADGTLASWGSDFYGALGHATRGDTTLPAPVASLSGIRAVAAFNGVSVALGLDGRVWTWGWVAYNGRAGADLSTPNVPRPLAGVDDVEEIAAGLTHVVFRRRDGSVWAWGYNGNGELGDGTRTDRNVPVRVTGVDLR